MKTSTITFPFNVTEFTGNLKPMCECRFTGKVNSAIYWYYGVKGVIESSHINSCLPFQIPCFVKLFSRWEFLVVLMNFGSSSWFLGSCCFLLLSCGRIQSCVEKVLQCCYLLISLVFSVYFAKFLLRLQWKCSPWHFFLGLSYLIKSSEAHVRAHKHTHTDIPIIMVTLHMN